jgi:hypothetical protein
MKKAGYGGARLLAKLQQEAINRRIVVQTGLAKSETLSPK